MSDEEILKLYRSGERERAFGELVGSYSERLYWHVRGLVGNHEDADDLLQDIFVKVWGALDGFRGDSQLFTWLFRIATNESLNFLRKRNLRQALGLEARGAGGSGLNGSRGGEGGEAAGALSAAERVPDLDPYFNGNEAQRLLAVAVSKLPPKQRAVFNLRYFQEMPYEQMAQVLETSVGALKASYHFAYEKVKDYLLKNIPAGF